MAENGVGLAPIRGGPKTSCFAAFLFRPFFVAEMSISCILMSKSDHFLRKNEWVLNSWSQGLRCRGVVSFAKMSVFRSGWRLGPWSVLRWRPFPS